MHINLRTISAYDLIRIIVLTVYVTTSALVRLYIIAAAHFCLTGITGANRAALLTSVSANGGTQQGSLDANVITHLIAHEAKGANQEAAISAEGRCAVVRPMRASARLRVSELKYPPLSVYAC